MKLHRVGERFRFARFIEIMMFRVIEKQIRHSGTLVIFKHTDVTIIRVNCFNQRVGIIVKGVDFFLARNQVAAVIREQCAKQIPDSGFVRVSAFRKRGKRMIMTAIEQIRFRRLFYSVNEIGAVRIHNRRKSRGHSPFIIFVMVLVIDNVELADVVCEDCVKRVNVHGITSYYNIYNEKPLQILSLRP